MPLAYRAFGSYILFKEVLEDPLGHLHRAAEFDKTGIKRTVFLRTFDSAYVAKSDIIDEFETAGRIAEVLQAANVVSNTTFSSVDDTPALAFEFIPSHALTRVFEKVHEEGFPVPVDNALLILEKLALALSAGLAVDAGGRSLVHGFLHPGLVMVTNDGEGLVSSFGFADQLLSLIDHAEVADAVQPYIAPEVLLTRTPSKRADVYSLGSILYQLLTGKAVPTKPEERDGILDTAELAYDERPIPDDIKALLTRTLSARPEERFSSAADFKKELDKLLYGGAYSPTTFNLALFMDRLFRTDIEEEEKERETEKTLDFTEYLEPEPEPEPEAEEVEIAAPAPASPGSGGKGMMIGIGVAAIAVVIAAVMYFAGVGRSDAPPIPPTPTAEEIAAKEKAEEERLMALAAQMIEKRMAEREAELREEMEDRQKKIDDLQKRLQETEKKTGMTAEEKRQAQELQKQLAAEQEAKRKREAEAEAERQKEIERLRQEAATHRAATATAEAKEKIASAQPTKAPQIPTKAPVEVAKPTEVPEATPVPDSQPGAVPTEMIITENMFLEPSMVDTMPVMIKEQKVNWTRPAMRSNRKGMIIIQATVDANGRVENVTVLRADEEGFGIPESVIAAVKKYRFKPATKNGIKVKSYATVTKRFNFRR